MHQPRGFLARHEAEGMYIKTTTQQRVPIGPLDYDNACPSATASIPCSVATIICALHCLVSPSAWRVWNEGASMACS